MEPILQNPHLTKLLRVWEFITAHYEFLELPEAFGELSIYELSKHIEYKKHMTSVIAQIIEALTKKAAGHEKTSKNHSTILFLAKNNKFNFFNELVKISFYELSLSQVNFSLAWRDLPEIDPTLPFEALQFNDRYRYLVDLISFVAGSTNFKLEYLEKIKKEYGEANQESGHSKAELHMKYGVKMASNICLGKDLENNLYFYFSKINDSIFAINTTKNQWKKITGQEKIKNEVVDKLIEKPNLLNQSSLDLLENIHLLWSKMELKIDYSAFDQDKELFDFAPFNRVKDKLERIKLKMHELDELYSKFIGDGYNFRWATKEHRIAFHNQINEAKEMKDIIACLSSFYHKTKHSIQKKANAIDIYDHSLSTDDEPETEFKNMFLRMNYLFVQPVFAENSESKSFTVNLYNHIKSFLELSEHFQPYIYEYLTVFVECMLGIIRQMYPGAVEKRTKNLEKLKKEQKEKEELEAEERKKGTKSRLKKNSQPPSSNSSSDEDESSTTADKNQSMPLNGRRLREKVRINYQANESRSRSKQIAKPSKKKLEKPTLRNQPKRNAKGKGKMLLDSDSDEDDINISLSESDTEKEDQGLSLDKFKYVEEDETQKFRRELRSSKGKA